MVKAADGASFSLNAGEILGIVGGPVYQDLQLCLGRGGMHLRLSLSVTGVSIWAAFKKKSFPEPMDPGQFQLHCGDPPFPSAFRATPPDQSGAKRGGAVWSATRYLVTLLIRSSN